MSGSIKRVLDRAVAGERLTPEEGLALFGCADLHALGRAADAVCDFCAFYRKTGDEDAYVLPRETLYQKIEETIALGGDQILLQGGNHPSLKLEWYKDLLRDLKARY